MTTHCRLCRTAKWLGDPCPNPDCSQNTTTRFVVRPARSLPAYRVATTRYGGGVHRMALFDGPKSLHGQTYVADVDGRHFYK